MNTKQLTYSEWLEVTGIKSNVEECDFCNDGKIDCDALNISVECDICDENGEHNCPTCHGQNECECTCKGLIDESYETYLEQFNKDKELINKLKA